MIIDRLDCFGVALDYKKIAICFSRWCGETDCFLFERKGIKIPVGDIKNLFCNYVSYGFKIVVRHDFYFLDLKHPYIQETDVENSFILGLLSGLSPYRYNIILFKDFLDDEDHFSERVKFTKKFDDHYLIKKACYCAWSFQETRREEIAKFMKQQRIKFKGLM